MSKSPRKPGEGGGMLCSRMFAVIVTYYAVVAIRGHDRVKQTTAVLVERNEIWCVNLGFKE